MATSKTEELALSRGTGVKSTAKPSSSRRYSTQQYTPTHTTFSNRNQKNLHSWVNASFNSNNNNNGNGGKNSSKNPSTASTVSSSAKTASSKPKPFPKLLPLSRESSQSSSSTGNNNNNSTNKEAVHRRLVNLFADINAFFAYKASSDAAAAAASTSGPGGGRGGGGDHQHRATTATSTSSIAHCRLRPLISRADALLARLDALLDDDAVLELLEDSTALGKLREYRLKLELRANTLGQLLEKRETRVKASQEEKAMAVAVEKLTAALISSLKDHHIAEEPLPKYGGLAFAHQFPTWLVAVKDLVLDSARPADDRAKFRRIFYALEDAADQRLISADADIESPDLCRVVKLLFNRHMGEGEEDGQGQEEEVGGGGSE